MEGETSTVAVIGLGSIGLRHAGNLLDLGCHVVGYDPDPKRVDALLARGGRAAVDRDAALAEASWAVVATPHESHLEHLGAAVRAGRHTFVEKPIADTVPGVEEVLDAAAARALRIFVGFNLRLHPAVARAKRHVAEGALGDLLWARFLASSYLPDWRPGQDHRKGYAADPVHGGVLFDFIHEFDLANHLLGPGRVEAAAARCSGSLGIPSEDVAEVVMRHPSGVMSSLHVDYVTRPRRRVVEIAGTGGVLTADVDGRRLVLLDHEGRGVEATSFEGDYAGDYREEMRSVIEAIAGRASDLCDGRQGLAALVQVVDARRRAGLTS